MSSDDNSPSSPPTTPPLLRPTSFTPPPHRPPPLMGVPGQSAFHRYNPLARAPTMSWPTSRSLFRPYRAPPPPPCPLPPPPLALVPVGIGSGSSSSSFHLLPPPMPLQMEVKRPRSEGIQGIASGSGDGNEVKCSVCGKGFHTNKALFGHMRSHPGRGWRGVHPPPAFRADEEFADILDMAAAAGQMNRQEEEGGGGDSGGDAGRLPDLNKSPIPESDCN